MQIVSAVLIYQEKYGNPYHSHSDDCYATFHAVTSDGSGAPVILPGRPMMETDYSHMVKALSPSGQVSARWLESNVLARGANSMIWWTPQGKRAMFFKKSSSHLYEDTFDGQAMCPVPALVWMAVDRSLYVFAIKGDQRPERDAALHQAPFFNVWARGQVCQGNASFPGEEDQHLPEKWEAAMFGSRFTHPNFTETGRLVKGMDHLEFWRKMVQRPMETFPQDLLVEIPFKVGDLLGADIRTRLAKLNAKGEF